jgi:outer membrane protein, heavy metal efflux system
VKAAGILVALAVVAGGCESHDPRPDMEAVTRVSEERGVAGVELLPEAELRRRVSSLLEGGLTADEAARIAIIGNRRARATYEELGIARADLVRAGLLTNPVFDFSIRFIEGGAGEVIDMGLTQRLTELLTLPTRRAVAENDVEAARARAVGAALSAAFAARRAVLDLQAAARREETLAEGVEARRLAWEFVDSLHAAGNVPDIDVTRRRMVYEESRLELARAELAVAEARETVNTALGLWGDTLAWELADALPEPPAEAGAPDDLEQRSVMSSIALEEARLRLQRAARRAGGAAASVILDDVGVGVRAERDDEQRWEVGPAFSIPIPIFDTGEAGRASAEAEMRGTRELYAAEAIQIRSQSRVTGARLRAARDEELHWRHVLVPLAERQLAEMLLEYNAMQIGTPALLDARVQLARAHASHAESLGRFWIAALSVDALLAGSRAGGKWSDETTSSSIMRSSESGGH